MWTFARGAAFCALLAAGALAAPSAPFRRIVLHRSVDGFAAREIRRYTYLTTGALPELVVCEGDAAAVAGCVDTLATDPGSVEIVLLDAPGGALVGHPAVVSAEVPRFAELHATKGGHAVHTAAVGRHPAVLVVGAGQHGRLYAAYTFAESLGVRFALSGETLPDPTAPGGLPLSRCAAEPLPETRVFAPSPVFDNRGLQPFHDFPEGPDWWDTQHYKQIITQLSKMKANFIGLHTYPYSKSVPPGTGSDEPTVWVGTTDGLTADGSVKPSAAYATSYANTIRNEWGYGSINTSDYSWGTNQIFESDCWAPPPTDETSCPYPATPKAQAAFFERTAAMLNDSFSHGNKIGVESCVGTETPLSAPMLPGPSDIPCTVQVPSTCYKDSTVRIMPHTVAIESSSNSLEWCAYQCYSAGYTVAGVEYGQACFCGNATPTAPTVPNPASACGMPCAGNATEKCGGTYTLLAYTFHCTGPAPPPPSTRADYDGIFTRLLKKIPSLTWYWVWTPEGWEWGHMNANNPTFTKAVADLGNAMASRDAINPKLKMATNGWVVGPLPDRSIFDKTLPTSWDAITSIDLNTGHSPVDPSYQNITRHAKWAIPWMEDDPDLTAPQLWVNRTLEHMEDAKKYGCTGLLGIHWRTKETGPQISAMLQKSWNPALTSHDFWMDWATTSFGANVAAQVTAVMDSIDSFNMPTVVGWVGGPGKINPGCKPASTTAFVSTLESIAKQVSGDANTARFNFWLEHFRYMRGIVGTACAWEQFNTALAAAKKTPTPATKAALLASRVGLISNATEMITALQLSFADVGTLGTYMNIEGHSLSGAIAANDAELTQLLGPLPSAAMPPKQFGGSQPHIVVPTLRTTLDSGEAFELRVLVLASGDAPNCQVNLHTRPLGSGPGTFTSTPVGNVGRSVFAISVDNIFKDFEWYVDTTCSSGTAVFPAGAPDVTQTVVVM